MRISTKMLASLLLVTAVAAAVPGISRIPGSKRRQESQFDRLLGRHDRKGELRARVLGISPYELRLLQKTMSFDAVIKRYGFADVRSYRLALLGKIKDELRKRGWSAKRIERYMTLRSGRLG